ncbi:hypothetical protein GGR56DRAFT_97781 [Xylariaceae sp. FL0804]|nr:hypothetical protein GGR56DRAFT_97781 [Xylariaceae sp. FL0804]
MLVTRQFDTEQSHWSSKFETAFHKPPSPRMSSYEGQLSTQPDWQGHYAFLPPGENSIFSQSYEQASRSNSNNSSQINNEATSQQRPPSVQGAGLDSSRSTGHGALNSPMGHQRSLDPLGLRRPRDETPTREKRDSPDTSYAIKAEPAHEEPLSSVEAHGPLLNPTSSSAEQVHDTAPGGNVNEEAMVAKEEEDEVLEDDEMVEGEGEASNQPQTAAERTAARRKMKRFRLTHQQTRFLMSEFAKQPHPDAAHRERLSREIPGLSPRQVQVWFQNRRAKIKRLTADDRDRMIKMRAVPDDFDNVQALHSPYGAVHPIGTPMTPPVDFGSSSYDHIMRPLMVDTMRRNEGDEHMSPTGLSPSYGGIGFTPAGTMGNSDILSPLSTSSSSNDRGYYSSHLSSPIGGGSRTTNPFARQSSLEAGVPVHSQPRQGIRPLQPLQLRETMSRSRPDSLQSPLRSSMSWKGDSIDYTTYPGTNNSPGLGGRHQPLYQTDQMSNSHGGGLGYESGSYQCKGYSPGILLPTRADRATASGGQSSTSTSHSSNNNNNNINYSSLQSPSQSRSRLRAASATLPLGLDLRHQYRSVSSGHSLQSPNHASTPRAASTTPYGSSSTYTSSYPSAPLTAPIDFSLSRTPGIRTSLQDYSMPQMSAPIAPPHDFSQALHGNMGGSSSTRTPMRDTFGGGPLGLGSGAGSSERMDEYAQDGLGLKRKRSSFSPSQSSHPSGTAQSSQAYGHNV